MAKSRNRTLAPDIGALVEYGLDGFGRAPARYRVTGWLRAAPPPNLAPNDWIGEILFEACQEIEDAVDGRKKRMQHCLREDATHLSLSGVCGAIAPVELCKVTGRVNWPKAQIDEDRRQAIRIGRSGALVF